MLDLCGSVWRLKCFVFIAFCLAFRGETLTEVNCIRICITCHVCLKFMYILAVSTGSYKEFILLIYPFCCTVDFLFGGVMFLKRGIFLKRTHQLLFVIEIIMQDSFKQSSILFVV
ncbi:hypothetical protein ACROYT_G003947 [Oculina patagonica]